MGAETQNGGRGPECVARGTVKRFDEEKGYGLIATDEEARTSSSIIPP